MGLQRLLVILPLVATLVNGQGAVADEIAIEEIASDVTANNTTSTNVTVEEVVQQFSPDYDPKDCDYWLSKLVAADEDQSDGLSEPEYHAFLSSLDDPPYIAEYFASYPSFEKLPWAFRIVHKSISCHCEKLGYGKNCCKGDDAELLLQGLDGEYSNDPDMFLLEMEYKDLACQQISYVLERNIKSPAPTDSPTESPSKSPSGSPTVSPSRNPTATPTASPPSTPAPTGAPSVSLAPSAELVVAPIEGQERGGTGETQDEGLGTGGIIGIIVAILLALLAIIALVAYRRKMEQDRLNKFAGEAAPEADLEAPIPAEEVVPEPEPEAKPEPDEDDESSAPSVWSEGEEKAGDIVEGDDGPVAVTAGSALAAMGAASTVATNLMTSPSNKRDW